MSCLCEIHLSLHHVSLVLTKGRDTIYGSVKFITWIILYEAIIMCGDKFEGIFRRKNRRKGSELRLAN